MILPIRVAIVGFGAMGKIYKQALEDYAKCTICAVFTSNVNNLNSTTSGPVFYHFNLIHDRDFVSALCLDLIIITTPEWVRRQVVEPFIDCNAYILIDKPLSSSLDDTTFFKSLNASQASLIYVCNTLAFNPYYSTLLEKTRDLSGPFFFSSYRDSNIRRYQRIAGKIHEIYWLAPHDISFAVDLFQECPSSGRASLYPKDSPRVLTFDLYFPSGSQARFASTFFQDEFPNSLSTSCCKLQLSDGTYDVLDGSASFRLHPTNISPDMHEWPNSHPCYRGYLGLPAIHMVDCISNQKVVDCINYSLSRALVIQEILDTLSESTKNEELCNIEY
jgi:predicted dehydrogenase